MPTKSAFSAVGLAHKVCLAAEEQGYTPELLNTLAENPTLFSQLLKVQLGHAEVKLVEHVIDLDADPFVPNGWKVEKHDKGGSFKWDAAQVQLFLSANRAEGTSVKGHALREQLAGKPTFNANLLDYLLKNPHLIPEAWKQDEQGRTRYIFFWGTIFRSSDGGLYVRCLYWFDGRWRWGSLWLGNEWDVQHPAALRAR
jgi:hypothetical protein